MKAINVVLTRGPGPDSDFVEVETDDGRSVSAGEWILRKDGLWSLRVDRLPADDDGGPWMVDYTIPGVTGDKVLSCGPFHWNEAVGHYSELCNTPGVVMLDYRQLLC